MRGCIRVCVSVCKNTCNVSGIVITCPHLDKQWTQRKREPHRKGRGSPSRPHPLEPNEPEPSHSSPGTLMTSPPALHSSPVHTLLMYTHAHIFGSSHFLLLLGNWQLCAYNNIITGLMCSTQQAGGLRALSLRAAHLKSQHSGLIVWPCTSVCGKWLVDQAAK